MQIREILVPTDFSKHSDAALEYAIEFARRFEARIHLLHVYQLVKALPWEDAMRAGLLKDIKRYAEQGVNAAAKKVSERGIPVQAEAIEGAPAPLIEETARRIKADLIVMGTRGLTGLKHVVLGSVAQRTLGHAPCPVVTVAAE